MKIYIPNIDFKNTNPKDLFLLIRPFYSVNGWNNNSKKDWELAENINYVENIEQATHVLLPLSINKYFEDKKSKQFLYDLNEQCKKLKIKAFGIIYRDFGVSFPFLSNIVYYRMSGFKCQLAKNNYGFPVAISDHFERIYKQKEIFISTKKEKALIGFCGHATRSLKKRITENLVMINENLKRFFSNPLRHDFEPLFASAYQRVLILEKFLHSNSITTNFILRKDYRAGAISLSEREKTTLEYYTNIIESDYIFCMRGTGNFSVRFYETLMMGKIPIFVNTDCLLPFEDYINWKDHVVWIEWEERDNIVEIVTNFHSKLSNEQFIDLQNKNRKLWKETLSVKGMLKIISKIN